MPWNEDDDDDMNDREGVSRPIRNKESIDSGVLMSQMNTNLSVSGKRSTRQAAGNDNDSFDDIEQQIQ